MNERGRYGGEDLGADLPTAIVSPQIDGIIYLTRPSKVDTQQAMLKEEISNAEEEQI